MHSLQLEVTVAQRMEDKDADTGSTDDSKHGMTHMQNE